MKASSLLGCLAFALALAGSGPAAAQVKQPPELLMSVGIGPDSTLDSLRAFANGMQPGAGMMLNNAILRRQIAGMVTATSLEGLDENAAIYVLAVDGGPALKGAAVVGKIADDAKLTQSASPAHVVKKKGWAVIGPKLVAEKVAPFALGSLAGQAITGLPVATIYTTNLMTRYKTELEDARKKLVGGLGPAAGGQMTAVMESYVDGLISALADSDRVIVTFDATKDIAAIDLALVPKAGTRLAKFIALQQPSDYALLGKLPATQAPAVIAGRLDAGPYRAGLIDVAMQMYGSGTPANAAAAIGAVFKAATGDFAMAMNMAGPRGMEMTQLYGVSDAKAADRALGQLFDVFKKPLTSTMLGMTITQTLNPRPVTHDGITIRTVDATYDLSKMAPDARAAMEKMFPKAGMMTRAAVVDKIGLVSGAADPGAAAAAIDAARGQGKRYAPTAQVTDFLAGSRARKESVAMVMDLGATMGAGAGRVLMLSMGFADKRAHFRFTLPASTVRGLAGGGVP